MSLSWPLRLLPRPREPCGEAPERRLVTYLYLYLSLSLYIYICMYHIIYIYIYMCAYVPMYIMSYTITDCNILHYYIIQYAIIYRWSVARSAGPQRAASGRPAPRRSPYLYRDIQIYIYIYIYMCIHIYVCMYVYIYIYIYIHTYIHICMCIYIYIYIFTLKSCLISSKLIGQQKKPT